MLRKIFAVLLGTFAVSAAICASGCNEARLDAFAYSETSYLAQTDEPAQAPVVSQAEITKYSHTEDAIRLYWGKAEGANGYDIYRQNVSDKEKWDYIARITDGGTNGYTVYRYNTLTNELEKTESVSESADYNYRDDTGLSSGTVYTYKAVAFADTDGEINYGAESKPFTAATSPSASEITRSTHTENAVRIYWNKVSGASGYEIYRYDTSAKKWGLIKTINGSTTLNYRDNGLSSATIYKYKVKAFINCDGQLVHGMSSEKFAAATSPAAAKITKFSHTENAVRIYWDKVLGASGYEVYRYSTSAKKWLLIKTINGNVSNYRDDDLYPGTVYKYKVKAFKNCGDQRANGMSSEKFAAATSPSAPTITRFSHLSNAVRIHWSKVSGASGYEIYRYNTSSKKWVMVATVPGNSRHNYRNDYLAAGTVYKYKVIAYTKCGDTLSHGASSRTFATITDPAATSMTGYKRTGSGTSATLYWRKVQCSGYYIQQYRNGSWITIKTVSSPNTVSASLTQLEVNKNLYFRIMPFAKSGSIIVTGKASSSYSLILPYTVTAVRGSVMKSSPAWSSNTLLSFNSGTIFYKLGTNSNWLRVEYNGTVGYIYNKAVTGRANYSAITAATLPVVADDWLFDNGTSISAIFNYTKAMYYATSPKLSVEEMAVRGFKLRSGACYYYASLMYYLLKRAGYDVYIIQGESRPNNEHWWNLVRTSAGWRHYDATPFRDHDYLYGTTDAQTAKYMTKWDRSKYPAAN